MKTLFILCAVFLAASLVSAQTRTNASLVSGSHPQQPQLQPATARLLPSPTNTTLTVVRQTPAAAPANSASAGSTPTLLEVRPDSSFLDNTAELVLAPLKPNEIALGKRTFSGIAILALKVKHPLQLLNPLAPEEYGALADNLEPALFRFEGPVLKFFAINF